MYLASIKQDVIPKKKKHDRRTGICTLNTTTGKSFDAYRKHLSPKRKIIFFSHQNFCNIATDKERRFAKYQSSKSGFFFSDLRIHDKYFFQRYHTFDQSLVKSPQCHITSRKTPSTRRNVVYRATGSRTINCRGEEKRTGSTTLMCQRR